MKRILSLERENINTNFLKIDSKIKEMLAVEVEGNCTTLTCSHCKLGQFGILRYINIQQCKNPSNKKIQMFIRDNHLLIFVHSVEYFQQIIKQKLLVFHQLLL